VLLLVATLVPSTIFGWWAYRDGVRSEFADVSERHLLIARNLGDALNRYSRDINAISNSVARVLAKWGSYPNIDETLTELNIDYVALINRNTGQIIAKVERQGISVVQGDEQLLQIVRSANQSTNSMQGTFTPVMASTSEDHANVMYAIRTQGSQLVVTRINTNYFVTLGKSISFGTKGHAAIVDREGNVLAHPLDDWIAQRKNISKVSAVQRMMAGETGVEQFYSPALKGDMIAGFTSVPLVGWGVMIPQPIEELYAKVAENNRGMLVAILSALAITIIAVLLFLKFLDKPITAFNTALKTNARDKKLRPIKLIGGRLALRELKEFQLSYNQLVREVGTANATIKSLAYTDSVTKLPNRAKFQLNVEEILNDSKAADVGGSLMFIDVDNFKMVNDLHGHEIGDYLLKAISHRIEDCATKQSTEGANSSEKNRHAPCVSRIGGDEFAILMPGLTGKAEISRFLNELVEGIKFLEDEMLLDIRCSASIGVAEYPKDGIRLNELMRCADIAMYQAKKEGKNRYEIYSSALGKFTENEICSDFATALCNDQLVLEYQPKVCTRRNVVTGVEALVRWNHPKHGRLSPALWLPAISANQLAVELGDWVINQAMVDLRHWIDDGRELKVAVNASPMQLKNRDIINTLLKCSAKHGIPPDCFELEVTEDALFDSQTVAAEVLTEISKLGFKISIDDFGTGYSNLSRLAKLPIDFIKIDQSLIKNAISSDKVESVLNSTISLAKKLNCFVVAEGIETLELAEFATSKGANLLQGYLFSPSLPSDDLLRWIDGEGLGQIDKFTNAVRKKAA
jgi:diguanylate cyclase (GGDEF)-like protein